MIADKLSRLGQKTESSLLQVDMFPVAQPQIDLFATRFNNKLPQVVSPVPDSLVWSVDALCLPWKDLDPYDVQPVAILGKVIEVTGLPVQETHSYCTGWANIPWFCGLVAISSQIPSACPACPIC